MRLRFVWAAIIVLVGLLFAHDDDGGNRHVSDDVLAAAAGEILPLPEHGSIPDGDGMALSVDGPQIKLDRLGPIIIQPDGTMTQISNWNAVTADEQRRTLKRIAERNAQRKHNLLAQQQQRSSPQPAESDRDL